jgi:hypothetical protein
MGFGIVVCKVEESLLAAISLGLRADGVVYAISDAGKMSLTLFGVPIGPNDGLWVPCCEAWP